MLPSAENRRLKNILGTIDGVQFIYTDNPNVNFSVLDYVHHKDIGKNIRHSVAGFPKIFLIECSSKFLYFVLSIAEDDR